MYGRPQVESNGITEINTPIQMDYKKAATGAVSTSSPSQY
jgi:hypothetical protein